MSMVDDLLAYAMQREQPLQTQTSSVAPLTVTANRSPTPGLQVQSILPPGQIQLAPSLGTPDFSNGQSPQPADVNYDNSGDVTAVNQALQAEGTPRGGMANPGVYGLLPQGLQHGVLRNALGALGDAFLVGSGRQAVYEPRMQQQELGNAMAGANIEDPASVQAAAARMAATGASGANEMADKLYTQAEQAALRRQYMQYNQNYRDEIMGNRHDQALQRMMPYIGGMVSSAHDQASYAAAYARAEEIAQRIGPDYHAADFGLPDPKDWQPGMTATVGMTANNVQQSSDRAAGRAQSGANNAATNAARIRAAQIAAGGHVTAAQISAGRPSEAGFANDYIAKVQRGESTTPEEDQRFMHDTQVSTRSRRPIPRGRVPGAGGGPGATDIAYLRAHPNLRAQFDQHFGAGASARILGQ